MRVTLVETGCDYEGCPTVWKTKHETIVEAKRALRPLGWSFHGSVDLCPQHSAAAYVPPAMQTLFQKTG